MCRVAARCKRRIMLTGTPLQNDLQELQNLLGFLLPDVFLDTTASHLEGLQVPHLSIHPTSTLAGWCFLYCARSVRRIWHRPDNVSKGYIYCSSLASFLHRFVVVQDAIWTGSLHLSDVIWCRLDLMKS